MERETNRRASERESGLEDKQQTCKQESARARDERGDNNKMQTRERNKESERASGRGLEERQKQTPHIRPNNRFLEESPTATTRRPELVEKK